MSGRGIFQGYGLQGVDDKGRVAIPVALRQVVEANNPRAPNGDVLRTLAISPSENNTCLVGYDQAYPAELAAELAGRAAALTEPGAPVARDAGRIANGMVDLVTFDASGRFVLQGFPKKFAKIGKLAVFLAVGPYFEIWDPETLLAERGSDPRLRAMVDYLLEERGGK